MKQTKTNKIGQEQRTEGQRQRTKEQIRKEEEEKEEEEERKKNRGPDWEQRTRSGRKKKTQI